MVSSKTFGSIGITQIQVTKAFSQGFHQFTTGHVNGPFSIEKPASPSFRKQAG